MLSVYACNLVLCARITYVYNRITQPQHLLDFLHFLLILRSRPEDVHKGVDPEYMLYSTTCEPECLVQVVVFCHITAINGEKLQGYGIDV